MKILVEFDVGCVVWPDISVRSAGEALLLDCYYCYDRGIANVAGLAVNDISVGVANTVMIAKILSVSLVSLASPESLLAPSIYVHDIDCYTLDSNSDSEDSHQYYLGLARTFATLDTPTNTLTRRYLLRF